MITESTKDIEGSISAIGIRLLPPYGIWYELSSKAPSDKFTVGCVTWGSKQTKSFPKRKKNYLYKKKS